MKKYICKLCNYVYNEETGDPKNNIPPKTSFEALPEEWRCPICDAKKDKFYQKYELEYTKEDKEKEDKEIDKWDLVKVREVAQKKLGSVCGVHRICDGHHDNVCMGQKYGRPLGFGGMGQGSGFRNNYLALLEIKIKTRLVSEHFTPHMTCDFLGMKLSMPVIGASMSGANTSFIKTTTERDFAIGMLEGARDAGTISFTGNSPEAEDIEAGIDMIRKTGGYGVPIFKPQPNDKLFELIKKAEEVGSPAVGVDLDGAGSFNWNKYGRPVERKTPEQLKELVTSTKLPFIFKGIMTEEDALAVIESGAAVLGISNHGGRVNDCTPGVAEVLPKIAKIAKGKIIISADGGIRTGFDVLKMIALGADVVLMGRDLARASIAAGKHGVKLHLEYIKNDLKTAMIMTGCRTIADITGDLLT
jgi:isopentenyl diphosphate isomerase/L-lactate dehydrogenase-like FMN-dependent dehydrogenase/rubredoxin